ncbi:Holliday junction resolvase [Virgibacillus sp. FSP13]
MKFVIPGSLPTMNEIIAASKKHHMVYANMKKDYTALVMMRANKLSKIKKADFEITWYCKNKRKDKDNIIAGQKFIFDGLIKAEVMDNDGWDEVGDIIHHFEVDKKNPRIEVIIHEL